MGRRPNSSAGLLLFRRSANGVEFFLAHPGGPFWRSKDLGAWTIPKGILEEGEDELAGAVREFTEETGVEPVGPFLDLGTVRQKSGKTVRAWAWEGTADAETIVSNEARIEWPKRSGRWITYPEVDRCAWMKYEEARRRINPAQAELLDRLLEALQENEEQPSTERT